MKKEAFVSLGLEKLSFNPERGGFEGGAIRKAFNKDTKKKVENMLPGFAKNLKPEKVKSFAEANKPLEEVLKKLRKH